MQREKYRHYTEVVKQEIARTGNIYLFPQLKIPRTTAQHWIKYEKIKTNENFESVHKGKIAFLEQELNKERALRIFVETIRKVFPFDFQKTRVKDKRIRTKIVTAVRECLKFHKLSTCLAAIGLSKSAYQRWASETTACERTRGLCERRSPTQLTKQEIQTMKKFVTSKKYAHISISSLHLLAQKMGELFCSLDSWYKYVRFYEWMRPWKVEKMKIDKVGVRAKRPNELWHIDVTVIKVRPGTKLYIQAIIDNFSRFVLAWNVTEQISAQNTIDTLAEAKKKAVDLINSKVISQVIMDPGSENDNQGVAKFLGSQNLKRVLARVDVHFSNSMVERLFHSLKNNFLYHQKIRSLRDLQRKADFYFSQHNEVVPMAVLSGGTPLEVYASNWTTEKKRQLERSHQQAILKRKLLNRIPGCGTCQA